MESPSFESLIGRRVVEIELVDPISWWFRFDGASAVRADTLWRLVDGGRISITSLDHGQQFGLSEAVNAARRAFEAISASTVQRVRVVSDTGDLVLEFDLGSRLEILTTSMGYESWCVFLPDGGEIIAVGGGTIHMRNAR